MHLLEHITGLDNLTGNWYGFWSGFGGIMERLIELFAIGFMFYYHHSCHVKGCLRLGRFSVAGGALKVCHHHHPYYHGQDITQEHVEFAYRKHKEEHNV